MQLIQILDSVRTADSRADSIHSCENVPQMRERSAEVQRKGCAVQCNLRYTGTSVLPLQYVAVREERFTLERFALP